jgi:SAM-dependent methyltransferase
VRIIKETIIISDMTEVNRRAVFDAAEDFTALGHSLWNPIGAATAAAAGLVAGDRVLGACCGAGASAIPAAEVVGEGGQVDAVDLSGPMVGELRGRAAAVPWLRVRQADATTWEEGGYDAVLCALGVFFFPDMAAGARHLIGLARPGGRVVFTIWRGAAMAAPGEYIGRAVAEVKGQDPPAERPEGLFDRINQAEAYASWLGGLGLSDVHVRTREKRLSLTPGLAWLVITGSGYRSALSGLGSEEVRAVRERYLAALRADGVTGFDATTLIGSGSPG